MATEEILMAGVAAGGDRQELHERIRVHSIEAGEAVKTLGQPNDLLARLATDPAFAKATLSDAIVPSRFIGRAPQQVDRFVNDVVGPIRHRYAALLGQSSELRV
jgi:adenylosuccinate lyase